MSKLASKPTAVGAGMSFGAIFLVDSWRSSSCIAVTGGPRSPRRSSTSAPDRRPQGSPACVRSSLVVGASRAMRCSAASSASRTALSPSPLVWPHYHRGRDLYADHGSRHAASRPPWLKCPMPRMPKTFAHRIMDAEETRIRLLLRLGAATVFLPCGFTQAFSSTRSRPAASGSCRDVARLALDGSGALSAWLASGSLKGKADNSSSNSPARSWSCSACGTFRTG